MTERPLSAYFVALVSLRSASAVTESKPNTPGPSIASESAPSIALPRAVSPTGNASHFDWSHDTMTDPFANESTRWMLATVGPDRSGMPKRYAN